MYNNLPQQTPPYYQYGYGIPQYPRYIPQETQNQVAQTTPASVGAVSMMQNYIKGRPVVSIDEARASQIDLDGSLYVFPDLGNKKIYTKQINMDGTASFNVFELIAEKSAEPESSHTQSYVTREELDAILVQFKASLASPLAPSKPQAAQVINL